MVPEHTIYYTEIVTSDVTATCALYAKTHGWQFQPMEPALGNARVAVLPDGSRWGVRAPLRADERPIVRTYIRVQNIEHAARTVEEGGALVALPPMEIPGHGTIAIYIHGGIEQGLWELP